MDTDIQSEFFAETLDVTGTDGVDTTAIVAYRDDSDPDRLLLVLPPNPMLGGDTQNNVVQALLNEAVGRGMLAMTCEYRGVSDGYIGETDLMTYWESLAEDGDYSVIVSDCLRAVETVCAEFGCASCSGVVGYSFGAYLALHCASRLAVPCVGISPPILEYDFGSLTKGLPSTHFLIAPEDVFCPAETAREQFSGQDVSLLTVESDDHFFRGVETQLVRQALSALRVQERTS